MASTNKDFGWEFLNSTESATYRGEDGSWGHKYSDGSGTYHGADGSYGTAYSDGSISYYGADGSRGYKSADGSSSFRGADGTSQYISANSETDAGTKLGNAIGNIVSAGIIGITAAAITYEREEERKRQEKRQKRRAFCRQHWKVILISSIVALLVVAITLGILEFSKLTPIGHDASFFVGQDYENVVASLESAGFTRIKLVANEDLSITNLSDENKVYEVSILGNTDFSKTTKYPYDSKIIIKYHAVELIPLPLSSRDAKGSNYWVVSDMLRDAGFVNITTEEKCDLITGWIINVDDIKSITVNGEKRFAVEDEYRPDAEIVITYHTLKFK